MNGENTRFWEDIWIDDKSLKFMICVWAVLGTGAPAQLSAGHRAALRLKTRQSLIASETFFCLFSNAWSTPRRKRLASATVRQNSHHSWASCRFQLGPMPTSRLAGLHLVAASPWTSAAHRGSCAPPVVSKKSDGARKKCHRL